MDDDDDDDETEYISALHNDVEEEEALVRITLVRLWQSKDLYSRLFYTEDKIDVNDCYIA